MVMRYSSYYIKINRGSHVCGGEIKNKLTSMLSFVHILITIDWFYRMYVCISRVRLDKLTI